MGKKFFFVLSCLVFLFYNNGAAQSLPDSIRKAADTSAGPGKINLFLSYSGAILSEQPETARYYALKADSLSRMYDSVSSQARAYLYIGDTYFYENNYGSAGNYYNKSLELFRRDNNQDGIAKALYYLAINNDYAGNNHAAMEFYHNAISEYNLLGEKKFISDLYYNIAMLHDRTGNNTDALEYYKKSLHITDSLGLSTESAATLNSIGVLYHDWGNYEESLNYYQRSLKIMREANDTTGIAQAMNNLGILYYDWGDPDKALEYYRESLAMEKNLGNEPGMSSSFNNIGIIYADRKDYDQALEWYNKSLDIEQRLNNKSGIATALNNLGELYSETGKPDTAIHLLGQSLKLEKEISDSLGIAIAFNTLSQLHYKAGNYQKSRLYNDSSFRIAKRQNLRETVLNAFENYANIFEATGNIASALFYQKKYSVLKDSLFNASLQKQIAELQTNYELGKKEREIELLNSKNKLHKLELENKKMLLRKQQTIMYISIGGFLVILIVSVFLFLQIQKNRKTQAILQKQNIEISHHRNELIKAKDRAEESDRLKTAFLANMSHELRTPLNGILGFTEILSSEISDPDQRKMAEIINTSSNRLLDTLNSIIDLSIIESNEIALEFFPVRLEDLMKELVSLYQFTARKKGLYLDLELMDKDAVFYSDPKVLRNLLNNLIDNSIKYTREGGITITVKLLKKHAPAQLFVKITDTGIGIDRDKVKYIFDKFRQVSEGHNRAYEGSGLGLTICRKYIELLNGSINVESERGKGSAFTVKIPVDIADQDCIPKESGQKKHPKSAVSPKDKPHVLVVENEETNLNFLKYSLKDHCIIETAMDGQTSVEKARKKKFDAILMDINLGFNMNGMVAAQKIKQIPGYKNIPIAAVTANAMKGQKEEFLHNGCDYYISKPFTAVQIRDLVLEMVSTKSGE